MKLFFDTNVVIDHALMRTTGQPLQTSYLIFWAQKEQIPIYISPCCIYTITYVLNRGGLSTAHVKLMLQQYLSILNLCNNDKQLFLSGLNTDFKDLEDSFQFMHCETEGCDYLITSNLTDFIPFVPAKVKVMSPAQFVLNILGKKQGLDY